MATPDIQGRPEPARLCEDYYDWCLRLARAWDRPGQAKEMRGFLRLFDLGADPARQAYERNVFVQRHLPVLQHLFSLPTTQSQVLDCACGTGYQALLFALAGAQVTAVDVYDKGVAAARRLAQALATEGRPLAVDIIHRDLFAYLEESCRELAGRFDVVWVSEAISHIHPLEEFLPLARRFLAPEGWLVVCETNVANPLVRRKIDQERLEAYQKRKVCPAEFREKDYWLFPARYQDPVSGREVVQANERMIPASLLRRMLLQAGYRQFQAHYRTFVPPPLSGLLGVGLVRPLEDLLVRLPLLRQLGIRYILFAR